MIFKKTERTGGADDFCTSALIETMPWRKKGEPLHVARAEVKYDGSALYVRMRSYETAPLATRLNFGDPVCRDSCLEFFFAPKAGDNAYFNFELNPLGTVYAGFSPEGTRQSSRLLTDSDAADGSLFRPSSSSGPLFWEVSYTIPYEFIRRYVTDFKTPAPGDILRCNFYTCCDDAPLPYYTVWHNISAPSPDYHRPECFGALVFE